MTCCTYLLSTLAHRVPQVTRRVGHSTSMHRCFGFVWTKIVQKSNMTFPEFLSRKKNNIFQLFPCRPDKIRLSYRKTQLPIKDCPFGSAAGKPLGDASPGFPLSAGSELAQLPGFPSLGSSFPFLYQTLEFILVWVSALPLLSCLIKLSLSLRTESLRKAAFLRCVKGG